MMIKYILEIRKPVCVVYSFRNYYCIFGFHTHDFSNRNTKEYLVSVGKYTMYKILMK